MLLIAALVSLFLTCQAASPKLRVKDGLSDQEHHTGPGHEHNPEFDHEAFLGKDDAKRFDELSPDESKEQLGKLFHKVDADSDGQVTEDELKKWIQHTQNRYIREDSDKQMKQNDMDKDGHVTWEEYKKATYGFLDENAKDTPDYVLRGKGLFKMADLDGNDRLNSEEFSRLVHPVYYSDMKVGLLHEIMPQVDLNNDSIVNLDEYIMFLSDPVTSKMDFKVTKWYKDEKKIFEETRDKNKDGKLDINEIAEWIYPDDATIYLEETKHLILESDENSDGKISKEEMLNKSDVFVSSSMTYPEGHTEL